MGELILGLFQILVQDIPVPQNLGELLPWLAALLFVAGFMGTLLDWLKIFVQSFGRTMR